MTETMSPAKLIGSPAKLANGAPLPLVALPQGELLTVNIEQIPRAEGPRRPGNPHPAAAHRPRARRVGVPVPLAPGCELPLHYHTGTAQVWTIQGRWEYKEYPDQPQTAGSYLYEPGGSVHTFFTPADNTEDTGRHRLDRRCASRLQRGRHIPRAQ